MYFTCNLSCTHYISIVYLLWKGLSVGELSLSVTRYYINILIYAH